MRDTMAGIARKLKPGFAQLPIDKIASDGGRPIDQKHVKALSESIASDGLLCPISVTINSRIVCGRHRLHACRLLGWKKIPAVVVEFDAIHAELAEIDENVIRKNLKAIERSKALARRKELYEALHPETAVGACGGRGGTNKRRTSCPSFSADTAAATGQSERQVRRDVAIGIGIPDEVAEIIATSKLADNKKQLAELAKLDADQQRAVAEMIVEGKAKTVKAALKAIHPTVADISDDDQDASGGAPQVTSAEPAGTEPDPAGVDSEPGKGAELKAWLVKVLRQRLDNDNDGIQLAIVSNVLSQVADECLNWQARQ